MKKIFTAILLLTSSFAIASPGNFSMQAIGDPAKIAGSTENVRINPVWSPDGNYIAFSAAYYKGIYVMDLRTKEIREITDEPSSGYAFEWSSDSKSILSRVAKYEDMNRTNAVKIFNIETSEVKQLTDYRSIMPELPHWGDSDQKVYLYSRSKLEIFDSGKPANSLAKAANNKKMFFMKDDHVAVCDISSGAIKEFDPLINKTYLNMTTSPDGSKIAFQVMGGDMFVMNSDGTGLVDLGKGQRPKWSPDSNYLVYMIATDDGHQFTSSDIYTIKYNGTEKQNITSTNDKLEMNPHWSPDGKKIAFDELKEGAVYVLEISK